MKPIILFILLIIVTKVSMSQVEPSAGKWKTWFIKSGKDYRLPAPAAYSQEISEVLEKQKNLDATSLQQIAYWNAGSPGYRWQEFINKVWMTDTATRAALSYMLLGVATYDATVAAWNSKYAFGRPRPFAADKRVKVHVQDPGSPSYPCEHSVAAGVAATIIAHFYPALADSVNRLAQQAMSSRIAAGVAFPSDTRAGFELGKRIAEIEIDHTKNYSPSAKGNSKAPDQAGLWKGKPTFPLAGKSRTVMLDSSSQFRPGPPPDFTKDMEELKKFKPNFRTTANAFRFASQNVWDDVLNKKMFEYNIHLNPPRAARLYAITAVGMYDGFIACWDAKYTYWGTRPDQYDTTFHPVLFFTPPFPGYPSGHAMIGAVMAELYSYFFPAEKAYFQKLAKDGAESRFQGGIHFRTDNEIGVEMGRKVGAFIVQKVQREE